MDIRRIREAIVAFREARYEAARSDGEASAWTQMAVAKRAGRDSSVLNKLEDVSTPMTEIRLRVVMDLVEKGLGITLSSFFAAIENQREDPVNKSLHAVIPKSQNPPHTESREADHGGVIPAGVVLTNEQYVEYQRLRAGEATAHARIEQATNPHRAKPVGRGPRPKRS